MVRNHSLAVRGQGFSRYGQFTQSFPKQKVKCKGQTAHEQAVGVLCKVNVHIHIMYRHHDHLHSWMCFFKVFDNKNVFLMSLSSILRFNF